MQPKIESEDMFRSVLKSGINLFTGAGFSVLPNEKGYALPTGEEYARILIDEYNINGIEENLDYVADLIPTDRLQDDSRRRFKVETINSKYYNINRINLKSFITTNYDNIPIIINERNQKYRLYDVRGGPQTGEFMVPYIPTHGNVMSTEYDIVIGSIGASGVNEYTSDVIRYASKRIVAAPTLIWGYGMRDVSTKRIFEQVIKNKSQDIWIQLLEDNKEANYFRVLGFKIIISDTESLLDWIAKNIDEFTIESSPLDDETLRPHLVPSDKSKVPVAETSDYFREGITRWFHILTNIPYERSAVGKILDAAYSHKRVIVIGSEFSGRTTAMMQAAHKSDAKNKFFFNNITMDMSEYISSKIRGYDAWIFLDDCPSLRQFVALSEVEDATIVVSTSEMLYESEKNLVSDMDIVVVDITEIDSKLEAEKIFEKVPKGARMDRELNYKSSPEDKYSMMEFITGNIKGALSKTLINKVLKRIADSDSELLQLLALTVYLSSRHSALSTEVIMAYFGIHEYDSIDKMVKKVNNYLRDITENVKIESDDFDQDYYLMRSGLFLKRCIELFEKKSGNSNLRAIYADMIRRFVERVSPVFVWNYDDFRRKEYDSELFFILFGKDKADGIYEELFRYSNNYYVIQQQALYHRRGGRFKEAFEEISKVHSKYPKNTSVKNSYALILFEMNREEKTSESLNKMKKAMDMLAELHDLDERKRYHTEKFCQYALYLAKKMHVYDYVSKAISWIDDLDPWDHLKTSKLKAELKDVENRIAS